MKVFNKVMNIIFTIICSMAIEALVISGINQVYYELPGGMDIVVSYLLCFGTGCKLGKYVANEIKDIIKS